MFLNLKKESKLSLLQNYILKKISAVYGEFRSPKNNRNKINETIIIGFTALF